MKKVIFVCLGNICRSPAAEGIMKAKLAERGLEEAYCIDSAGTYGGHSGSLPDSRMREHAAGRGYDLNSRSRKFYPEADFTEFDWVIAMDDQNVANLKYLAKNDAEIRKICKMTDFCRAYQNHSVVPDPYFGGDAGFELVLDLLEDAVEGLIDRLENDA